MRKKVYLIKTKIYVKQNSYQKNSYTKNQIFSQKNIRKILTEKKITPETILLAKNFPQTSLTQTRSKYLLTIRCLTSTYNLVRIIHHCVSSVCFCFSQKMFQVTICLQLMNNHVYFTTVIVICCFCDG